MATNTGANGGKNNTGNGVMRSGANINQNPGINSALNQANYRREYNEKMFSDNGFLKSSIDDLNKQSKELEKLLKQSKDLSTAEKKRYENAISDMKKLAAEQNQMFRQQEASSKELQNSLNKSAKVREKAVDDLYKHYMKKEKELSNIGKQQVQAKIDYFAAQSREIKAQVEDINDATENFNKAKKTFSQGLQEGLDKVSSGLSEFVKVVSLQNMSSNAFLDKANERYAIMNKINSQLGYDASNSTRTYNSMVKSFNSFNENMGNLFSLKDLNQYIQDSNSLGIHNEKMLQDSLQQSMIANKYLGLSVESQSSMYKYMKLTNNNDMISSYNKTMIALQKKGIGVSENMLDELIKSGETVDDVLTASGVDINKWNTQKEAVAGYLSSKGYTDSQIKSLSSAIDEAVTDLTTSSGLASFYGKYGMSPDSFKSIVQTGNYADVVDAFAKGTSRMSNAFGTNDMTVNGLLRESGVGLGLNVSNTTGYMVKDLDEMKSVVKDIQKQTESMTDKDVENAIENNKQQSWIQGAWSWLQGKVEEIFGGSGWLNFETVGTMAFTAYLAADALKVGKTIIGAFKQGGFVNNLFTKFFGKGSSLAGGAEQMSLFATGEGAAGGALSALGAGAIAVGLTAAALAGINALVQGRHEDDKNAMKNNQSDNLKALEGTTYEGDLGAASIEGYIGKNSNKREDTVGGRLASGLWDNGWDNFWGSANNSLLGWTNKWNMDDPFKYNTELWKNFMAERRGKYQGEQLRDLIYTYVMMLKEVNSMSAANELFPGTNEDSILAWLKHFKSYDEAYNTISKYLNELVKNDMYPVGNGRNWFSGTIHLSKWYDEDSGEFVGYHMAGLNRVPRDGYRAMLHKDEMVLNKSDAEIYRQLLGGKGYGFGGSLNPNAADYVGSHHSGYAGHNGIDLYFDKIGTPVGSAVAGVVSESKDIPANYNDGKSYHGKDTNGNAYSSYGRVVKVKGDDGHTYVYAHLNERAVSAGDKVDAGTLLGYSGTTGNSSGPHLHFEVVGAGTGEAAHAKYYTPYVRSANGASAMSGSVSSDDTSSSSTANSVLTLAKVNRSGTRAIPGLGGIGGPGNVPSSTERIVKSVDGVSEKIINYLNEIRKEQADQRRLINAFSNSQSSIQDYR